MICSQNHKEIFQKNTNDKTDNDKTDNDKTDNDKTDNDKTDNDSLDKNHTLNYLSNQIVDRFKFIFREENTIQPINISQLKSMEKELIRKKIEHLENDQKIEVENDQKIEHLENDQKSNKHQLCILFKKIHMYFAVLKDLLKYCIIKININKYKKILDETFEFPKSLDEMISVIGFYSDAFTPDVIESLFNIITYKTYNELYSIGTINTRMIEFVVDDDVNKEVLTKDFLEFAELGKFLASDILKLNTDLEPYDIIEYNDICFI
jgi:hypothetical protein